MKTRKEASIITDPEIAAYLARQQKPACETFADPVYSRMARQQRRRHDRSHWTPGGAR